MLPAGYYQTDTRFVLNSCVKYMCDIVIPMHDHIDYTRNCIESILRNTSCKFRILFIDDASVEEETIMYLNNIEKNPAVNRSLQDRKMSVMSELLISD